ncbi:MAG: T9SS type A sorting domain-containing protein [Bacteroidia bacterium]
MAQVADNPQRGLYVNSFADVDGSGNYVNAFSILGVDEDRDGNFEKEEELLNYAQQNHFTTLILYNLRTVFNSNVLVWDASINQNRYETLTEHLCRFMKTARTDYGITRIFAAVGGSDEVNSVEDFNQTFASPTAPIVLTPNQLNSPFYTPRLSKLVQQYPVGDPMLIPSEVAKFAITVATMNNINCDQKFDGFVSESEFWVANSITENETTIYEFEVLMNDLNQIKNTTDPSLTIAVYYGKNALNNTKVICGHCMVEYTDGSPGASENCSGYCDSYVGEADIQSSNTTSTVEQPFNEANEGARRQYIYSAGELHQAGLAAGNISSLAFKLKQNNSANVNFNNFLIRVATTSSITNLSSWYTGSWSATTTAGTSFTLTPSALIQDISFISPFYWNGTDNIVVDISYDNDIDGTQSATVGNNSISFIRPALPNSCRYYSANNPGGVRDISNYTLTGTSSSTRPEVFFRGSFSRRADEIFLEEYVRNVTDFSGTIVQAAETAFENANTIDHTTMLPIFSAESKISGAGDNFLGEWMKAPNPNSINELQNIFSAETAHFRNWKPGHSGLSPENKIIPGGYNWFTSSYLLSSFKNPPLFYTNAPICGSSGLLDAHYIGPREKNIQYTITISNSSGTIFTQTGYTPDFEASLTADFLNDATNAITLLSANSPYTMTLELNYGNNTVNRIYSEVLQVSSSLTILPIGYNPSSPINICSTSTNDQILLKASKSTNIDWYRDGQRFVSGGGEYVNITQAGDYYAVRTAGSSCVSTSNHITVTGFDQSAFISSACSTSTLLTLTANENANSNMVSYLWSTGETTQSILVSPTAYARNISVIVQSLVDGCSATNSYHIPKGNFSSGTPTVSVSGLSCSGNLGTVTLGISGDNYPRTLVSDGVVNRYINWYGGPPITNQTIQLPCGHYVVNVIGNGMVCGDNTSFDIGTAGSFSYTPSIVNNNCYHGNSGSITVSISSGSYTFEWVDIPSTSIVSSANSTTVSNLLSGTYKLKITDNSCHYQYVNFTVTDLGTPFTLTSTSIVNNTCYGNSNGAITQVLSPTPTSYLWSNGAVTSNLSGLSSDYYSCKVTNSSGCTQTFDYFVDQPAQIDFKLINSVTACSLGGAEIRLYGGVTSNSTNSYSVSSPWTYVTGSTNHYSVSGQTPPTFPITITDDNACAVTLQIPISANPSPTVSITGPSTSCMIGQTLTANSSDPAVSYLWYFNTSPISTATSQTYFASNSGVYTVEVTNANGCTGSSSQFQFTISQNPSNANAGSDQTICGVATTNLSAIAPTVGTGAWTIISGTGGNVATPTSNSSSFSGINGTTYILRWTVSNPPCSPSTDDVSITFNPGLTAFAGSDQNLCGVTSTTLNATQPTVGNGTWTIVSGSGGTLNNPTSSSSGFSGTIGSSYTLRWTVISGSCTPATDDVVISFYSTPVANAGADQSICGFSTSLFANTPSVGTGTWTIISGAGGTINNPGSPSSGFSGSVGTSYSLRWTVINGSCTPAIDDVVISFYPSVAVNAGPNQQVCAGTIVNLQGMISGGATSGTWNTNGSGTFSNSSVLNPTYSPSVSDLSSTAPITLTLTSSDPVGPCPSVSSSMQLTFDNSCCGNYSSTLTQSMIDNLTMPYIITGSYNVNSNLHITKDLTFKLVELAIGSGYTITIDAGKTLTITNNGGLTISHLFACSNNMWGGIINNGSLNIDNSTIEDAMNAVTTLAGNQIQITGTIFDHNYTSLKIENGNYSSSTIRSSTFRCSGGYSLKAPYLGQRTLNQIEINNADLTIGDPTSSNNDISGSDVGIHIENLLSTGVNLFNNTFHDFDVNTQNSNQSGMAIYATRAKFTLGSFGTGRSNYFYGNYIGVLFTSCSAPTIEYNSFDNNAGGILGMFNFGARMEINHNNMSNMMQGITMIWNPKSNINIRENIIQNVISSSFLGSGISVGESDFFGSNNGTYLWRNVIHSEGNYGIYLNNLAHSKFIENRVYLDQPTVNSSDIAIGIRVDNSDNNYLSCNEVDNKASTDPGNKYGISVYDYFKQTMESNTTNGTAYGIQLISNCEGSYYLANTIKNHAEDGLLIGDVNNYVNTYVEPLVTYNGELPGNLWNNNTWDTHNYFQTYAPPLWTKNGAGNPDYPRYNTESGGGPIIVPFPQPGLNLHQPLTCNIPVVEVGTENERKFDVVIAEQIASSQLQTFSQDIVSEWKAKTALYQSLKEDPSQIGNSTILAQFYNATSNGNIGKLTDIKQFLKDSQDSIVQNDSALKANLEQNAKSINDGLTPEILPELNEKIVTDVYLNTVARNNFHFESQYVSDLMSVGLQCVYEGGPAVLKARNLLHSQYPFLLFNDYDLCNNTSFRKSGKKPTSSLESSTDLFVYPNPATNQVSCLFTSGVVIEITDLTGRAILSEQIPENSLSLTIDISDLTQGSYIVVLKSRDGILKKTKLNVVR